MGQSASRAQAGQRLRYAKDTTENLVKTRRAGPSQPVEAPIPGNLGAKARDVALQPDIAENAAIDTAQKDPVLSGFLNQLGGSVAKRQVQEYYGEGVPDPIKRRKKGQLLEGDQMRISIMSLLCLLEESKLARLQGEALDIEALAASYEVDPEILRKVLQYCTLPVYTEDDDGKVIGSWPNS